MLNFMQGTPPANTHPSIYPHSAPKARHNNRKAPASPHTTRAGEADLEGHPDRVKAEGWQEKLKKEGMGLVADMC